MRKVRRDEIVDYQTYNETRDAIRPRIIDEKARRRAHVGEHFTFLFENTESVRYQVQEMMRTEQIVKEKDIVHELQTYNDLLGDQGVLGATLLIEISDEGERAVKLRAWKGVMPHLYARLSDGLKVYAQYDKAQVGDERLSSVQYLKFDTKGKTPVAFGIDAPVLSLESPVSADVQRALTEDLRSDL
jgi:hypothetical protein